MTTNVKTTITHNGVDYEASVMTIESTSLGCEDHGIWTAMLNCKGDNCGISIGGFSLDTIPDHSPLPEKRRTGSAYGMDHLMEICRHVGVDRWEQIPGKKVYVLYDPEGLTGWGGTSVGFANIDTGKAFILKEHAMLWHEA